MAKPIVMPFRLWFPNGPRNHKLDVSPDPPWERALFRERVAHCKVGTFCREPCRKGWTNRFCHLGSRLGWAEQSTSSTVFARWHQCTQLQSCSAGGANVPKDTVQKWLNRSICHLRCGLGWTEGSTSSIIFARWCQCTHMAGHIGAAWRIRLSRPSAAAMRSYVKLLWPLVSCCYIDFYSDAVWNAESGGSRQHELHGNGYLPSHTALPLSSTHS